VRKTVIQIYKQGKYCKKTVETLSFGKRTRAKMVQVFKRKGCATALPWQAGSSRKITAHTAGFLVREVQNKLRIISE